MQAMLQSQAECLTRKTEVASLYRQLHRMLVWSHEYQLSAELAQADTQLSFVDSVLQHQILSALANLTTEFKGQRNRYQFSDQLLELYAVQLEPKLFTALILTISRAMIARQRNCELLLSVSLTDQNDGQYIIGYQFSLLTDKASPLPVNIAELMAVPVGNQHENISTNSNSLLAQLLQRLFASDIFAKETDTGYQLSFSLPHTKAQSQKNQLPCASLVNKQFLYVTSESHTNLSQQLIITAIEEVKAAVEQISIAQASKFLTAENSKVKSIDGVVISDISLYQKVSTLIQELPEQDRVKLYCLTGKAHLPASVAQGVFDHIGTPLNKHGFIDGLKELLASNKADNLVVSQQALVQHRYLHTGIEVLLAVADFSRYSVLYQLLNYLGFNVTITASAADMLPLWQSGRHLILISEFTQSPIVELDSGKQVQRGIIATDKTVMAAWQPTLEGCQWHLACLGDEIELDQLKALLATWLVVKEPAIKDVSAKRSTSAPSNEPTKSPVLRFKNTVNFDDLPAAFALEKYAQNQAGAENAAYMLGDSVSENIQLAQKLKYALSVKSYEHVMDYLTQLTLNAKVLSAVNLLTLCEEIQVNLSEQHYHACQALMPQIIEEVELIAQYAEAI